MTQEYLDSPPGNSQMTRKHSHFKYQQAITLPPRQLAMLLSTSSLENKALHPPGKRDHFEARKRSHLDSRRSVKWPHVTFCPSGHDLGHSTGIADTSQQLMWVASLEAQIWGFKSAPIRGTDCPATNLHQTRQVAFGTPSSV